MATPTLRNPENHPGPFFVDVTCIDCDLCRSNVPEVFRRNEDGQRSYVWRQPETLEEMEATRAALCGCPTDSIGEERSVGGETRLSGDSRRTA